MTPPGPAVTDYIPVLIVCVACHRMLRVTERTFGDKGILYLVMPCPCIAEKKGITSELPQGPLPHPWVPPTLL